ncbi:MAG: serine--tRNA ligase [Elusimicrobia bacterium]|nr:serine--tRNA ligase [Elusimicrobiota bacterium]
MIDLNILRNNPEELRGGIIRRGGRYLPALEEVLKKDGEYRRILREVEALREKRNRLAQEVAQLKTSKTFPEEASRKQKEGEALKAAVKAKEEDLQALEKDFQNLLFGLPNPPHASVPDGEGPGDNRAVREGPTPRREFDFNPKDHQSLGEALGILDFGRAVKLSGSRFPLLKGSGAAMERALIGFMLDLHIQEHGYTEIFPPLLVCAETMRGTGQLPKFEEELYRCREDDAYLIPTAEVPLVNLHRAEILDAQCLPLRYVASTACFRREAGSYGKDTRGLIRNHQFNKVELVWFSAPEESLRALESLTAHAEEVLRRLELPYRVVELCAGDLGFASAKTYDLEVWMPGEGQYREVSSCSTCGDFQARRIHSKLRRKQGRKEYLHTLNGSGVAVGRTFAAILENFQRGDGTVEIPSVLRPYLKMDLLRA